ARRRPSLKLLPAAPVLAEGLGQRALEGELALAAIGGVGARGAGHLAAGAVDLEGHRAGGGLERAAEGLARLVGIVGLHAQGEGPVDVEGEEVIRRTLVSTEPGAEQRRTRAIVLEAG